MDFVTHFYENPAYPNSTYTVGHPALDDRTRIIAISDIHGNLAYLRGLTDKLHLRADDALVLLGDLVEKGPESLATLRYAMALRERCRVYPVLGNCDFWHLWVDGCDEEWDRKTLAHLLRQKATARSFRKRAISPRSRRGCARRLRRSLAFSAPCRSRWRPTSTFLSTVASPTAKRSRARDRGGA